MGGRGELLKTISAVKSPLGWCFVLFWDASPPTKTISNIPIPVTTRILREIALGFGDS